MAPVVLEPPLAMISADARVYPVHLLRDGDSGLCLFAAAFLGVNDAIHMARNRMRAVCVDTDARRLAEMRKLYPVDWTFATADAWDFAANWTGVYQWDAVSVDTWTGDLMERSLGSLELWCSLARRVVTVTIAHGRQADPPEGWRADYMERSSLADWLVLTRA